MELIEIIEKISKHIIQLISECPIQEATLVDEFINDGKLFIEIDLKN